MGADTLWQLDRVSLDPARLCDVSLAIPAGITAVIGWSGAGKTSLLNLLVGFEQPDRGRISGNRSVAWVPHNAGLWHHCTALEHLAIARPGKNGIVAILDELDLSPKADVHPGELSQGEQSRLAVARALAAESEVLVMDEPLAHVDPARAGNYWRLIRETVATSGVSLVFATHSPEMVLGEAERLICLKEGRVVHVGPVRELYNDPQSEELMSFLGPGNWFTPEEARRWLALDIPLPRCFRPEQITIQPKEKGAFVVQAARFRGSYVEVELSACSPDQPAMPPPAEHASRIFFHRPRAKNLVVGARAAVLVGSTNHEIISESRA